MINIKQGHLYEHPEFGRVIATKSYNGHGVELMECIPIAIEFGPTKRVYPFINELAYAPMKYFSETS